MQYKVKIVPIASTSETWEGPFATEKEAWEWVDKHDCPYMDYDVVPINDVPDEQK